MTDSLPIDADVTVDRAAGLRIGTAPDSWGVWFPDDPNQVPWQRFLDEVVAAGYSWIELGPYGYLPTDPHQLEDELGTRGLKLSAGTVFTGFHKGDDQWQRAWDQALAVAGLASKLGAEHLVVIPDMWRDEHGAVIEPRTLTDEQWAKLAAGHNRLGKALLEEFGVRQQFHSHADSHIGTTREVLRFLDNTDPHYTNLCLDTGHFAYYGGDSVKLIQESPDRIGYLHLKQVDPSLLFDVLKNDVSFADAVPQGIMIEPPHGVPEFGPIIDAVAAIDPDIFAIVEQDMYGCDVDRPLPIAQRTREHIFRCTHLARFH
ncbi:sugar phosphate isomerase/epimerase family protein [Microbacterium sp. CPCC 204701]|uniref:sugar phosphate isomerase/epimerase family protein n=1 Tax=Microbacterium sp. CPCC 204701 TaxID=2493084 RepID=UPI000FD756FA|nr:sugar phosphate isomerase/epimerase [Microbacterium sp. CPCC 204701]